MKNPPAVAVDVARLEAARANVHRLENPGLPARPRPLRRLMHRAQCPISSISSTTGARANFSTLAQTVRCASMCAFRNPAACIRARPSPELLIPELPDEPFPARSLPLPRRCRHLCTLVLPIAGRYPKGRSASQLRPVRYRSITTAAPARTLPANALSSARKGFNRRRERPASSELRKSNSVVDLRPTRGNPHRGPRR